MYRGDTSWDFLQVSRRVLICSAVAVIICVAALFVRGLNLGIEFEGGGVWESPASEAVTTDTIDDAMSDVGMNDARIQRITGGDDIFRVRGELPSGATAESVGSVLAEAAQVDPESVSARTVSPSFGDQVAGKAQRALIVFFILIALYLTLRFEWKMALGALLAVAHDIALTVGIYALFQFEISPATVVAFLTIMGYSLYDTIVVFDRVKDNERSLSLKADDVFRPCQRFAEPSHHAIYQHNYHLGITGPIATSGRFAVHGRNQPSRICYSAAHRVNSRFLQFSIRSDANGRQT